MVGPATSLGPEKAQRRSREAEAEVRVTDKFDGSALPRAPEGASLTTPIPWWPP